MVQNARGRSRKRRCRKFARQCSYPDHSRSKLTESLRWKMRALIQRVKSGKVTAEGKPIAKIGHGLVIMLGIGQGDTEEKARFLAEKTATLRVFTDFEGKFNQSLLDVNGAALVISQFTLYSDC